MKLFNFEINIDKQNIAAFFSNRKRNIILIVLAALFVINLILGAVSEHIVALMPEMNGAERWSENHRMAQISLYFTEDQMVEEDGIKRLEYNLEKKMTEVGITVETYYDLDELPANENNQQVIETIRIEDMGEEPKGEEKGPKLSDLYASCYSAQGLVTISFENRTAENVNAIGVGGDFFIIHPLTLVAGSFFDKDSLMKDAVIIDEELAWQLFGSSDVIDQMVSIGGIPHYIRGVVKKDTGRMRKAAGLDESYVYLSYDSLSRYGEILSGRTQSKEASEDGNTALTGGINCYEVIMPNPVDGIALKSVKESTGVDDKYIYAIDNTDRFSFFSILKVIKEFGTRSMWGKPIFYPYWENTARGWEDVLGVLLFFRILCVMILVISLVIWIVHLYRHKTWGARDIIEYLADKKYEFESRRRHYEKEKDLL